MAEPIGITGSPPGIRTVVKMSEMPFIATRHHTLAAPQAYGTESWVELSQLVFNAPPQASPPAFAGDPSHKFLNLSVPFAGFQLDGHRLFVL
jgi:hypothetical protein